MKAGDEWDIAAGSQAPWVAVDLCRATKLLKSVQCGSHLFWWISEEKKGCPRLVRVIWSLDEWTAFFPKIAM